MLSVYGIKNCDTVQRALQRLRDAGIEHRLIDFKTAGLDEPTAQAWIDALGVECVLNRRGTSWRQLDEATRSAVDAGQAAAVMSRLPSLVKRPVMVAPGWLSAGFSKADEAAIIQRLSAVIAGLAS